MLNSAHRLHHHDGGVCDAAGRVCTNPNNKNNKKSKSEPLDCTKTLATDYKSPPCIGGTDPLIQNIMHDDAGRHKINSVLVEWRMTLLSCSKRSYVIFFKITTWPCSDDGCAALFPTEYGRPIIKVTSPLTHPLMPAVLLLQVLHVEIIWKIWNAE